MPTMYPDAHPRASRSDFADPSQAACRRPVTDGLGRGASRKAKTSGAATAATAATSAVYATAATCATAAATMLMLTGLLGFFAPAAHAAQPQVQAAPPAAVATPSSPTADEPAYVAAAEVAAKTWLQKLDDGDYRGTWDTAAASFRKAITRDKWDADVGAVRKAVGALQVRNNRGARFTRSLPGAPDGDYVLIQNDTRFQHKAAAMETVTMAREADGVWRLAGYFVR